MENFKWSKTKITTLDIELTNNCNAACPLCPRFIWTTPVLRKDIKLKQISLKQFKSWFSKDFIFGLKRIVFCGTQGDPTMAKDLLKILNYIKGINNSCSISINTNGGSHDKHFWEKLGYILNRNTDSVIFSIDGLENTNHLYRRNINWSKLINNVKAFISTDRYAIWDFLEFKHNEHQIDEVKKLSKQLGFIEFRNKNALGFESENGLYIPFIEVYNKNGDYEYKLEPPTIQKHNLLKKNILKQVDLNSFPKTLEFKDLNEHDIELEKFDKQNIHCQSCYDKHNSGVYLNCNGILYPCCFIGTHANSLNNSYGTIQLISTLKKFGIKNFDLNQTNIKTIKKNLDLVFSDSWFKNTISNGKLLTCVLTCGKQNILDYVYKKKI